MGNLIIRIFCIYFKQRKYDYILSRFKWWNKLVYESVVVSEWDEMVVEIWRKTIADFIGKKQ